MTRINCHSAFKHYEMFHSSCGGGNNYGSIFNTTYNIDCNGHGGFWGGFGYGLGNAFGGIFGGLFGGGMGFGGFGSGFGMGFPSMGGFGMNFGFPSWGNIWGGGNNRVSDSDNSNKKTKAKDKTDDSSSNKIKDPDREKLANHVENVKNLLADDKNLTPEKLKDLYDKINADKKLSENEPNDKTTDLKEYNALLDGLQKEATKRGWGDLNSDDFGKTGKSDVGKKADEGTKSAKESSPTDNAQNKPNTADSSRTYANGFSNYDGKTTIKSEEFKKVHDEGSNDDGRPKDIVPKNSTDGVTIAQESQKAPSTITVKTQHGTSVTYTITNNGQPNEHGEYIYTSPRGQEYILQKGSNGYQLMQYSYHKGYNIPDTY